MAIFPGVQYCIYTDIVGGWVIKSTKISRRNIGMVPISYVTISKSRSLHC